MKTIEWLLKTRWIPLSALIFSFKRSMGWSAKCDMICKARHDLQSVVWSAKRVLIYKAWHDLQSVVWSAKRDMICKA